MLIAQITDIHLGFEPDNPRELNRLRLDDVIAALLALNPAPDLLVASGDLTETGTLGAYAQLREALSALTCPILLAVGNHDIRANLLQIYPDLTDENGFIQYAVEAFPLRIVVADTLDEGRHDGAFCTKRADWLDACLLKASDRPTLLVLHHPPVPSGIDWMTTLPGAPWTARLETVVRRHPQIVGTIAGHVHRAMTTVWAGLPLVICGSTAPQVALDFKPTAEADMRPLIVGEPPAFTLHRWSAAEGLTSYFGSASRPETIVPYDARMKALIDGFKAEALREV